MHSLLKRQLKKSGVLDGNAPEPEAWQRLLERIDQSYAEADQERYLLERSLSISSREMQELSGNLQEQRDRLSAILASLGDGVCALDATGRVLFMNPAGERLLGWQEHELVGLDLLATVGAPAAAEWLDSFAGADQTFREEDGWFIQRHGTRLPVSYVLTPLTSHGRLSGVVLIFRDITKRKQALEAQTQLARRESLLRLARRFASESDTEQVFTDLLDEAVAVLGGDDGTLTSWDPARGVLVPVRNTLPNADEFSVIELGTGGSGRAAERRSAVVFNDYQRESGSETPAGKAGVRASVCVPLLHEGRLLGTLGVNTYDPDKQFTLEDAEVLELLAGIASGVLASLERTAQLAAANEELKQARDEAHHQALHDGLTTLPNRVLLNDRLQQAILLADRDRGGLALLMLDLDRFKDVNDILGHHTGDELLQQVALRLRSVVRASDTVARLGGDEFAVVLPTAGDTTLATRIARIIVQALEQPFSLGDHQVAVGASVGVAVYPDHGADAKTLLRHADVAMYVAKRGGGGYAMYSYEQDMNAPERLELIGQLRDAINNEELVLYYQPKLSLSTGRCIRVEALVRWRHPKRGLVPPDQFIPLAEQTGLIRPLTKWVLSAAVRQCREWQDTGTGIGVAVNLSTRNLHDPDLVDQIATLLRDYRVAAELLKVEVTESAVMTDPTRALETLSRIRDMGVEVSIDDFGTGHSSLSYLKHLPVAEIKLDRSFVRDMQLNDNDFAIVRSTVELAHKLGLRVVAEGVEDRATWDLLVGLQCDAAQGYYMSPPLSADDLQSWLDSSATEQLAA